MDKLKVFFAKMKKHHFWVLTGLVFLLSLSIWYLATGGLADEYKANKAKIEAEFTDLSRIVSTTNHANKSFEDGTKVLETELRKDVDKAWTLVYSDQKTKVLKWPKELGDEFLEWMDDPANHKAEIDEDFRDSYWNYVKEEFPNLLKIVDARPYWDKDDDEVGGGMGGVRRRQTAAAGPGGRKRPQLAKKDYKVIWDKKNQQAIDEQLEFPRGRPNSQQVRFCQENLWVYNALLDAIAEVNQGATGQHNAKIKQIIGLNIGQDASQVVKESQGAGRIMAPDGGQGGLQPGMPAMPMGEGAAAMPQAMPEGGEGMREGMMPGGVGGAKPLDDKRYVDEKGVPMPTGTEGPAEFKRMPILMRLFMDQREIAKLLVRLANSPLPVEIRQLRINTKMQGFSNPRQVMFGSGQDAGGALGGRGGPGVIKQDKAFQEATENPYDVAVELHGIIYIFNPPNPELMAAVENGEPTDAAAPAPGDAPPEETPTKESAAPAAEGEADPPAEPGDAPEDATTEPAEATETEPEPKAKAADDEPTAKEPAAKEPSADADEFDQGDPAEKPAEKKPAKSAKPKPEDEAPFGEEN